MGARRQACSLLLPVAATMIVLVALISEQTVVAAGQAGTSWNQSGAWSRATQSWALGLVVPDGSKLQDGGLLSWKSTANLTVVTRLPNITNPDGVTYLILSAEGNDGSVFQVALGVWPGSSSWTVSSWYITGLGTGSLSYRWVLNCSGPQMVPGAEVAASIGVSQGSWWLQVEDLNTSGRVTDRVASPGLSTFVSGDQEVFALESYSRSSTVFKDMGNATMLALYADGKKVVGGWYLYGGWDPTRNPLFTVGTSDPPTFISGAVFPEGRVVWSYDALWTGALWNTDLQPVAFAYVALGALVPVAFVLGKRLGHGHEEADR